MAKVGVKGLTV